MPIGMCLSYAAKGRAPRSKTSSDSCALRWMTQSFPHFAILSSGSRPSATDRYQRNSCSCAFVSSSPLRHWSGTLRTASMVRSMTAVESAAPYRSRSKDRWGMEKHHPQFIGHSARWMRHRCRIRIRIRIRGTVARLCDYVGHHGGGNGSRRPRRGCHTVAHRRRAARNSTRCGLEQFFWCSGR